MRQRARSCSPSENPILSLQKRPYWKSKLVIITRL